MKMPHIKQAASQPAQQRSVLIPFIPEEALSTAEACALLGRSKRSLDNYIKDYGIGRRVRGRVVVSRVAVQMFLEDDWDALSLYVSGDRSSDRVTAYYCRLSIPLPATAATAG